MARLLSVNVGLPRDIAWKGYTVHTGVWKHPVRGRCRVGRLNLQGDGQGDLAGHGGEHRAVFVYQIESYRYWQEQLERTDFVDGQFGENFTVERLPDDVCSNLRIFTRRLAGSTSYFADSRLLFRRSTTVSWLP
jgi:MOSC domain-containing protein YiiM